jgi:5-methylcytosine-specific restriction endonuclease McrA
MASDRARRRAFDGCWEAHHRNQYGNTPPEIKDSVIRLLVLQPSEDFDSVISCQILQSSLYDRSYKALSYVWGDPAVTAGNYILVDGQEVNVTSNLASALRHLRHESRSRKIWVDALCINQDNLDEKRSQIAKIDLIYTFCTVDIVWMGERDKRISRAIEIVKRLKRRHERGPNAIHMWAALMQRLFRPKYHRHRETDTPEVQVSRKERESLELFFTNLEVWRRIWIVQEVALATSSCAAIRL